MIEADALPPLNAVKSSAGSWSLFAGTLCTFVRDDYLASYEGDRLRRSAALVARLVLTSLHWRRALRRSGPSQSLSVGTTHAGSLETRQFCERLPHARLDVLEAGHCVWEERAPEFESIVAQWVSGGFRG
jgi:pimeloyl-ACP methyl ester carboxylesterase